MKRLAIFLGVVSFFILAGAINGANNQSQSDAPSPTTLVPNLISVNWLPESEQSKLTCSEFNICLHVKVKVAKACQSLQLTYPIYTPDTTELIATGSSYWGSVAGNSVSNVEIGISNNLKKYPSFGLPQVKCLQKSILESPRTGMYDFPPEYCSISSDCYSTSVPFWSEDNQNNWTEPDSGGSGYQVVCNDGWVSQSGGIQGACSHHGGVRD